MGYFYAFRRQNCRHLPFCRGFFKKSCGFDGEIYADKLIVEYFPSATCSKLLHLSIPSLTMPVLGISFYGPSGAYVLTPTLFWFFRKYSEMGIDTTKQLR